MDQQNQWLLDQLVQDLPLPPLLPPLLLVA
nr:hypothetical protein Q903MT_gene5943 [Picea sitchensis]